MMPSISGVAIDTLLFNGIGSPLCHRYQIISWTGSHVAFWGTYLHRLRVFLEESDSVVVLRLHRQLAQELAARFKRPTDRQSSECAISICSRSPDCFLDTTTSSTERSYRFVRRAGVSVSSSDIDVFCTDIDGSVAPSVCWADGWTSSVPPAVVDCIGFAGVAGSSSFGNKW